MGSAACIIMEGIGGGTESGGGTGKGGGRLGGGGTGGSVLGSGGVRYTGLWPCSGNLVQDSLFGLWPCSPSRRR